MQTPLVKYIVIGLGNRGQNYIRYALENPSICKAVAIAEPREAIRKRIQEEYKIPQELVFPSYTDLISYNASHGKIDAQAVVICVQDQMHKECAVAFAKQGYHILLEKPMAVSEEDCEEIVKAIEDAKVQLAVCHVMRYSLLTQRIKHIIEQEDGIGQIVNIQHLEPVGHWHFAHSFVRGNWKNEQDSTFMLMAKACHDVDILYYLMKQSKYNNGTPKLKRLNSFGSLFHFNSNNKPVGAAAKCLQCPASIERQCPYSAKKVYLEKVQQGHKRWPVNVIVSSGDVPDIENVMDALENTNYGKCVYDQAALNNNVCDNQTVMMEFDNGATATLSVVATTHEICQRKTRIFGTMGELDIVGSMIRHVNFITGEIKNYNIDEEMAKEGVSNSTSLSGHGYADYYLMKAFIDAVRFNDPSKLLTNARETLFTHKLTFDAERSRKQGGALINY